MSRCQPHWERLRVEVPATREIDGTAMCDTCFFGAPLRPEERLGFPVRPGMGMPSGTVVTAEAARIVGVSRALLHAWIRNEKISAPKLIDMGGFRGFAWTADDLERARKYHTKSCRRRTQPSTAV
jgi:hypothetical protein